MRAPLLHSLLLPGDEPGADALLELAVASGRHPDRDLLYGDEVRLSPVSKEKEPFFKPDYLPRSAAVHELHRPALGRHRRAAGENRRHAGQPDRGWRIRPGAPLCRTRERCAPHPAGCCASGRPANWMTPRWSRRRWNARWIAAASPAQVLATPIPGTWRVRRAVPSKGKVSIIIPTCASHGYIETCIKTSARQDRLSRFRNHLYRQHSAVGGGLEGLAAAECRQGHRNAGRLQLVGLQQPRGRCRGRRVPAVPERRYRDHPGRLARCDDGACAAGRRSASPARSCCIATARCSMPACSLPTTVSDGTRSVSPPMTIRVISGWR